MAIGSLVMADGFNLSEPMRINTKGKEQCSLPFD